MDETHQPLPTPPQASFLAQTLSEWKTLALLGGPILIAQLAQMANGVIDTVMAGHYRAEDLAAVGIGSSLWAPLLLFFFGTLSAQQPTISGHRGSGETAQIMPVTWQGLYIAGVSMLLMIALLLSAGPLLPLLGLGRETASIAEGYLQAFVWGVPALLLTTSLRGLTDGLGHTRVIMVISLISALLNLPLNYMLIYGKFGLPEMGGVGCGWATALSNTVAAVIMLAYLHISRHYRRYHLWRDRVAPDWSRIRELLRLGLPIGASMFVEVSMFGVIALFLAPLGAIVVAGHQIVLNITAVVFMVPLSLGFALTLRVSFLIGAQSPEMARRLARTTLLLGLAIAMINMPVLMLARDYLVGLYTSDAEVIAVATRLLMFAAIFQLADVLQVTAIGALRGYKDTRIPLFIMIVSFWGVCLPLGYALTFTDWIVPALGAGGFWLALIVGLTCASVLLITRLWRF
ncbi:MATE family efflux transporter [Marinimicrobium sp. ARAG 43.8]|uniref:MATE family efflux transporter n=1 Tax=Marinimicrobium sp. ARAG 43.8 TaxID=3418719 RepID=UPI003CEC556C